MAIIERGEDLSSQRVVPEILEQDEIAYFVKMGFLHRGRDLEEVMCDCWDAEFCSVVRFNPDNKNSPPVRYCRHCGFTTLAPEDIQTWDVDTPKILNCLAEAAGFPVPVPEIPELTWSMGRCRRKNLCYVRNFRGDENKKLFLNYYKNRPGTVFLTSQHFQAELLKSREVEPIIDLEPFIEVEDSKIIFDREGFLQVLESFEDSAQTKRGKRADRLCRIEKLTNFLCDYVRSVIECVDCGKEIPRRPTQAWVAKSVAIRQPDVSNCLKDKEAIQLRYIWDNMETYDGLDKLRNIVFRR